MGKYKKHILYSLYLAAFCAMVYVAYTSSKYRPESVSILFTDIASYSTIIEHMSPETAVQFLNEYFSAMHDVIDEHEGQIINYIGDSVMVVFGAPEKIENHEIVSVKCAIKMREKLDELNEKWNENEFSRYWKNPVSYTHLTLPTNREV